MNAQPPAPRGTSPALLGLFGVIAAGVVTIAILMLVRSGGEGPGSGSAPPQRDITHAGPEDRPDALPGPSTAVDTDRVVQMLEPGKRYRTVIECSLISQGTHKEWGIEVDTLMAYQAQAEIIRHIESNDGERIVFVQDIEAGAIVATTEIRGMRLRMPALMQGLIDAGGTLLRGAPPGWSAIATDAANRALDSEVARQLMAELTRDPNAEIFTFVDDLNGKRIRITYENGVGVTDMKCLNGKLTADERDLIFSISLLGDAYLLPDELSEPGSTWRVLGRDLQGILDPSLRSTLTGHLTARRDEDEGTGPDRKAVVKLESGRLGLQSLEDGMETTAAWSPRGHLEYSYRDRMFTHGKLTGSFEIVRRSTDHFFFESRFSEKPDYTVTMYAEKLGPAEQSTPVERLRLSSGAAASRMP